MASLETASQQLNEVAQQLGSAGTRFQDTLSQIESLRAQDLAAQLTIQGGSVEGLEAPTASVNQLESFVSQMAAYSTAVAEVQNNFLGGQEERNEGIAEYVEGLEVSEEKLRSGAEQLSVQATKAQEVRDAMAEVEGGGGRVRRGGEEGGGMGVEGLMTATEGASLLSEHMGNAAGFAGKMGSVLAGTVAVSVGGIVERFADLDGQVQGFVDETGIAAERAGQMRTQLANMTPQLRRAGLEISDMVDAQTELGSEFGSFQNAAQQIGSTFGGIQDPAKALRAEITQVAGRLRIGGQEAAEMISGFQELAATTGMSRQNLQRSAMAAAETADVAPKAVMQDIAENSEQLASFSGMSGEKLAAAAAQARNLGTNIGSIAETTEQIVTDIPGFVQGLEKARSLSPQLGINAQQLTRAAVQSPAKFQKELATQLKDVNFDELGVFAKQRLEDAIPGQTIADMQRMAEGARRAEMSQAELTEKVSQGKAPMTELFDATESQTAFTKLQNELSALVGTISVALVPTFDRMNSVLTTVLQRVKGFVSWAQEGAEAFQEWTNSLGPAHQSIRGVVEALAGVGGAVAVWQTLSSVIGTLGFSMTSATGATSALVSALGLAGTPVLGLVGGVTTLAAAITYFREPLMDAVVGLKQGLVPALEPVGAQFDRLLTVLAPVGDRLMTIFETVMAGSGELSWVAPTFRVIGDVVGTTVASAFRSLVSAVEIVMEAFRFLRNTTQFIRDLITLDFDGAVRNWGEAFDSFSNIVSVIIDTFIANIANMASAIFGVDAGAIESALDAVFVKPIRSVGDFIEWFFTKIPQKIPTWLSGAGQAIVDALTPTSTGGLQQSMSSLAGTVSSYLPSSPAEAGPLSNLDQVDVGGEVAKTIQPEPVRQQMESTMGQATQAATEGVQAQQMDQANQVQVDAAAEGGGGGGADLPDGIVPLLQKISQNEKQILAALQNLDVDAYLDSKKVTDKLRKENNKNTMKTV